ncbi:hypothetical protein [Nostoc sp.]|uniref:hypothetical protein n=1 Tax=Nostoc sp. TaxID=1180 RepID=UPI002FFA292E
MSLESRLKHCHEAKQQLEQRLEELGEELADLEYTNGTLMDGIKRRAESIDKLEKENQHLTQQLQTAGASGRTSNIESTVANSETIDQLQSQVMSLETSLKISRKKEKELEQILEKLVKELADVKRENDILKDRQQLQTTGNFPQPDYEATRDRTLNKLKIGKQSTAGKAIDAFIKELKHGL